MKKSKDFQRDPQRGFTLIEALLGIGMVAVVLSILSSFSFSAYASLFRIEKTNDIAQTLEVVRLTLSDPVACTKNLGGRGIGFNSEIKTGIASYNRQTDLLSTTPFLEVGKTEQGMKVSDMRILQGPRIDDVVYLADLQITFEMQSPSPQNFVRKLPLQVKVQNGIVEECWYKSENASFVYNQVCSQMTGGALDMMDPATGKCGLAGGKWFEGDYKQSKCPSGTYLPKFATSSFNCQVKYPPGFRDSFDSVDVTLTDGSTTRYAKGAVRTYLENDTESCFCDWAKDLSASSYIAGKCMVLCVQP